ncbi:GNAT family N-acetyltransferase [Pseudomonas putida]|uniref:GNAT family N-acetyltransferase n=1 Tax=Pseudomonas putida TaxID=303 RepID=UPI002363CB6A|nr:GNAT family N-acetyltransferase [Pseudomonas putida]MDD2139583.1 GNAT family N-acetyltransferase [Pseudomonas putida]HDS1721506.1 GNAT family N-acetyltransferase [Pseudomonas putida]
MKVVRLTRDIPAELQQGAIKIASDCAKDLSVFTLVENDPFEKLAKAEVCARLESDFFLIANPMNANGVMSRGEAIFVLDESHEPALVVGFAAYKPRFPAFTSASISYIAVAESHRGQGVMRLMMNELLEHHPVVALDCPIELEALYEKFGFYISGSQAGHIVMETGPLNGQMFSMETADLMEEPPVRAAKQSISKELGSRSAEAFRIFNQRNEEAVSKAAEFARSKKSR